MTARAASSAPRRSDATRAAILEAARERFAADGYERATIRAIARDARIDPSMVMRYYGSKEGLFAAASAFDLRLPALGALPGKHVGAVLVGHFLDRWEQDDVLTGLLKVGVTNEAGADRMRAVFAEQLGPITAGVCPDPADAPAVRRSWRRRSWVWRSRGTSCGSSPPSRCPGRRSSAGSRPPSSAI